VRLSYCVVNTGKRELLMACNAQRYLLHARQAQRPWRGEGLREAAERPREPALPRAA
jgi:hypothetical protein